MPARVGEHPAATGVADLGQLDDIGDGQPVTVAAPQVLRDGVGVGQGVQAAAPAALADQAVFVDGGVAELAGRAVGPAIQGAVENQPGSDAGSGVDEGDVLEPAGGAPGHLGQRAEVGVVVDQQGQLQHIVGGGPRVDVDPWFEGGGPAVDAGAPLDRAGNGHADADDL